MTEITVMISISELEFQVAVKQLLWALPTNPSSLCYSHQPFFTFFLETKWMHHWCHLGSTALKRNDTSAVKPKTGEFFITNPWSVFSSFTFNLGLIGSSWVQPWGLFRGSQKMSYTRQPGISLSTCISQAKWVTMCMLTYPTIHSLETAIYVVDKLCWLTHSVFHLKSSCLKSLCY